MNALKHLLMLSIVLLVGCAPPQTLIQADSLAMAPANEQDVKPGQEQQAQLPESKNLSTKVPTSWELSGAMAARSKNKAWTASINWLQRGASSYQIRLFGPIGSGTMLIERQGGMVSLRDGAKSSSSSNADELLSQKTGVRLPVNNLYYWVRGVPAPGPVQAAKRAANNQLLVLRQAGFTIEYLQFTKIGNALLPSLIRLQGNGVFVKLVIKRWKV